jgi:hypothetical protein
LQLRRGGRNYRHGIVFSQVGGVGVQHPIKVTCAFRRHRPPVGCIIDSVCPYKP